MNAFARYCRIVMLGGLWFSAIDCAAVFANEGGCPVPTNDLCENATNLNAVGGVCDQDGAGGQVNDPDLKRCSGEGIDGDQYEGCFDIGEPCRTPGDRCLPWLNDGYYCEVDVNNVLATTDGPPDGGGACTTSGSTAMQADVWYRYTMPCIGLLSIRTCDDPNFDMMLGVYNYDQDDCPPTDNTNLLACDDDYCPGSATTSGVTIEFVCKDQPLLIRVAGRSANGSPDDAGQGVSTLEISVFCAEIFPAFPPKPAAAPHDVAKNRYISFDPNNGAQPVAFQVTLPDDRTCWVGEPCLRTDANGVDPEWVAECVSSPAGDGSDMIRDWSSYTDPSTGLPVVHVRGCVILPDEFYDVQVMWVCGDLIDPPLRIGTVPAPTLGGSWANIVGDFDPATRKWDPPDNITGFKDIAAGVQGFQKAGTAPVTWTDLTPHGASQSNYVVGFDDIGGIIQGFQSLSYPGTVAACVIPVAADPCP